MTTNAIATQGTLLKRGDGGGPEVFTAIGEVADISGPGGTANIIDATHLASTFREKVMGLPDEGQITFTLNYVPGDAQQQGLKTDRANRTLRNFQLVLTDAGNETGSFAAYVIGFNLNIQAEDIVRASVTLEITGAVTWVA